MTPVDWNGPTRQPCPACVRGPKDKTMGVTVTPDRAVAHCFRCELVVRRTERNSVQHDVPLPRTPLQQKRKTLSEFGYELWAACRPLAGDALAYLQARSCVVPPVGGHLRYHPALKHAPSGTAGPALVALVTDAATGQALTLHRTWIRADGSKAPLDPPRMLLSGHRKAGGVVRLWPDEAVTQGLCIAEGIETALSLAHAFTPVWACIDAGNLAELPVLEAIESLCIAADHDPAGVTAAEACARRWFGAGREVRVVMADAAGADLNDVAMEAAA